MTVTTFTTSANANLSLIFSVAAVGRQQQRLFLLQHLVGLLQLNQQQLQLVCFTQTLVHH
jgi:hypothetical protein